MHSIEAAITVHASVGACYKQWLHFESFPQIMSRVISVQAIPLAEMNAPSSLIPNPQKDLAETVNQELLLEIKKHDHQIWRWEFKGPLGQIYTWDAGIVQNLPDKTISWSSIANQEIPNTGTINFLQLKPENSTDEKTLVEIRMSFSAPGGIVGEFLSDSLHYGDNLLCEALEEFKQFMERQLPRTERQQHSFSQEKPMTSEKAIREELSPGKRR